MSKVIAIANQKGGVGKTTTAVNLSASLSATTLTVRKQRILLIDLDPQGNATGGSGINKADLTCSVNEALLGDKPVEQVIVNTRWGYDLLPSNGNLTVAEVRLLSLEEREKKLQVALSGIHQSYDFILIDCPPSLNMLTINALAGAHSVLIPVQCEYYALEGLTSLLSNIDRIRKAINPCLQLEGVLRTMYDSRNRLTTEVSQQLKQHFGGKVYQTTIPRNVRVAEAPSHGMPITSYDKSSLGARAYFTLTDEFLRCQHQQVDLQKEVTV